MQRLCIRGFFVKSGGKLSISPNYFISTREIAKKEGGSGELGLEEHLPRRTNFR